MCFLWTIILVIYGCVMGFEHVPGLAWWLLLVFAAQDQHDSGKK